MPNIRGPVTNVRNSSGSGRQSHLPPKSPYHGTHQSYVDYDSGSSTRSSNKIRTSDIHRVHQRTSSESFLIDEQPSWLDDLLNEPETPVRRGNHRRSSSDSLAYAEASDNVSNLTSATREDFKYGNLTSVQSWGSGDFDYLGDFQGTSSGGEVNSVDRQPNKAWDLSLNSGSYVSALPSRNDNFTHPSTITANILQEQDGYPSSSAEKHDQEGGSPHDLRGSGEKIDMQNTKSSSEADMKRSKQQYAQRSRVRKLQYIADLERHVQALQAEGSEIAAEIGFLDQQNLILNMENKALKQQLNSLAQEQLIKYMEHEVLEREISRLRVALYQLQLPQQPAQQHVQPQEQQASKHQRRSSSKDLDSQFAGLSLNNKDTSTDSAPVHGPLHI